MEGILLFSTIPSIIEAAAAGRNVGVVRGPDLVPPVQALAAPPAAVSGSPKLSIFAIALRVDKQFVASFLAYPPAIRTHR